MGLRRVSLVRCNMYLWTGCRKINWERGREKRDTQSHEMLLEQRDDNELAVLGVHISATIAGFAHILRAVLMGVPKEISVCLMVPSRDNVAHNDVSRF